MTSRRWSNFSSGTNGLDKFTFIGTKVMGNGLVKES